MRRKKSQTVIAAMLSLLLLGVQITAPVRRSRRSQCVRGSPEIVGGAYWRLPVDVHYVHLPQIRWLETEGPTHYQGPIF